jgi:hypothetical protein
MSLEIAARFDGLRSDNAYEAHYLSFTNGGKPPEEVLEAVHDILKDVHNERYRQGIIDACVAQAVGGTAVLAIVDHSPSRSEIHKLKKQKIHFEELAA